MPFTFTYMNEEDAETILAWRYEAPYTIYMIGGNSAEERAAGKAEMLDRRSPYYAVRDEQGELVGFFNFGTSSLVWNSDQPGIYIDDKTLPVGLGMRPDLTGKGLGSAFVEAGHIRFAVPSTVKDRNSRLLFFWHLFAQLCHHRFHGATQMLFIATVAIEWFQKNWQISQTPATIPKWSNLSV